MKNNNIITALRSTIIQCNTLDRMSTVWSALRVLGEPTARDELTYVEPNNFTFHNNHWWQTSCYFTLSFTDFLDIVNPTRASKPVGDFQTTESIFFWLSIENKVRDLYSNQIIGFKNGVLWNFSGGGAARAEFNNPERWAKV